MPEYILNLLPLRSNEEQAAFQSAIPDAVHCFTGRSSAATEQIAQATIILGWPKPECLSSARRLRWLHTMWAGADEYLVPGILPPGVMLTSSSGSNSHSVAEHMLACLLSLCRKLHLSRDYQHAHLWQDTGAMQTLFGATVLIIGAGNVGAAFGQMCKGLGARTVGLRRRVGPPPQGLDVLYPIDQLEQWLPQADVVALTLPHSPQTAGLMNRRRIAMLKDGAILLSAGRGSVLDQEALADALTSEKLWGAALDVTNPEPLPEQHPLWDIKNLIITPHVAGGMRLELTRKNCLAIALDNLRRYAAGQPLVNLVQEAAGEN